MNFQTLNFQFYFIKSSLIWYSILLTYSYQTESALHCLSLRLKKYFSYWYSFILHSSMADYNATDKTEDWQRKQVHSENGIRSPSLMGSNKEQEKVGTGGEVLPSIKTSNQWVSIARRLKSLLLLKGINLEERSASIASFHLVHRRHLLP